MPSDEIENVRVVVRLRPLSTKELEAGHIKITEVNAIERSVSVRSPDSESHLPTKKFFFDLVFDTDSRQVDVYNETARPIVDKVLAGYNGTIFAYGQTGTGKTFTMEGVNTNPELRGIIPNSFAHIFGHIAKANEDTKFLVRVSYFEIYNEEVRDLLSKQSKVQLEVKERPDIGVYIKDLSTFIAHNADDMERIMVLGNKCRVVGATAMNDLSSRSHAIFSITVETSQLGSDGEQHVKMGKLHLVDLAGSERQSKSGAEGLRLKEAAKINLSLSTLGNVISALVDGNSTHIPYRNSKLTRILQQSLGGNSKTVMCAMIGPANYNYDETISTLRYANRAKNIQNHAHVNEDPKDALLRQFQLEILALKKQLEETSASPNHEETSGSEGESSDAVENHASEHKLRHKSHKHGRHGKTETPVEAVAAEDGFVPQGSDNEESKEDSPDSQKRQAAEQLLRSQKEATMLKEKIASMTKKILVGGENLLEKALLQDKILESSKIELEERRSKEEELRKTLHLIEGEQNDMEEHYSSLQEKSEVYNRKVARLEAEVVAAEAELADMEEEHRNQSEGLLESVRMGTKELELQQMIEHTFIPNVYQELIEQHSHWNEDIGEWQLDGVAYTGNNMRKTEHDGVGLAVDIPPPDLSGVYLTYSGRPTTSAKRISKSGRFSSSRADYHSPT